MLDIGWGFDGVFILATGLNRGAPDLHGYLSQYRHATD